MLRPAITGGLWDCHTHIYGPWDAFPLPAEAAYRPAQAPMTDLLALHRRLGVVHGVLVQAACYRSDHSALLAALAATDGRYRGVALIDETMTDADLRALHTGGVRGVRFNFMGHLPGDHDLGRLRRLAERVRPLGWHALLHGHLAQILPVLDAWRDLDMPLVVDHMARQDATREWDAPGLQRLERHLAHPQRWIKLSGVDRMMQGSAPPWNAALPLARRLLGAAPDRAIWGTDWPHPNIQGAPPDDERLLDFLLEVCGGAAATQAVLVDNAQRLYF
jgi:predicted TIM-barrel fold metal-dependent hydrolase